MYVQGWSKFLSMIQPLMVGSMSVLVLFLSTLEIIQQHQQQQTILWQPEQAWQFQMLNASLYES